jgi:hypothetical protein
VRLQDGLRDELDHLAQQIGVGPLLGPSSASAIVDWVSVVLLVKGEGVASQPESKTR